jgi:quinol monooxygenase YgiN
MIIVQGHVQFDPTAMAALRSAAAQMVAATRAEAGCLAYSFAEDVLAPGTVHVVEQWESWAALDAHFKMPHMAAFNAAVSQIKPLGGKVTAYETGASRVLMGG